MNIVIRSALVVASTFALMMNAAHSQSADANARAASTTSADNTKINQQDLKSMNATADDQKNNMSDLKITQQIRRSVIEDKSLSSYAHNAKIVSVNGTVTLNGTVQTEAEKSNLAQKAAQVVGNARVVNDIKVVATK